MAYYNDDDNGFTYPSPDGGEWQSDGGLHGNGPWAPSYNPGPNYNGGDPGAPPAPRYDYNGGSPPDQALTPGHGWEWEGPQTPIWNMGLDQWDRGVWQERAGSGLGYQAPAPSGGGAPNGAVAPMGGQMGGGGIRVPSAQLPGDISALFGKVPEKTPIQSAYQDALLKFMGRSAETPSLNDSILGPQTEVYRAAQQRGMERGRRVSSERAAATGRSESGYLDNLINQGLQEQNFNTASFNSNLLGKELDTRRKELQAGLQLAAATGDQESERELRTRLAQVSAMMQQQGLNLQGQLGAGDLALRQLLGQQGNDQFYDQLGVNSALSMEGLNQNALRTILGG